MKHANVYTQSLQPRQGKPIFLPGLAVTTITTTAHGIIMLVCPLVGCKWAVHTCSTRLCTTAFDHYIVTMHSLPLICSAELLVQIVQITYVLDL